MKYSPNWGAINAYRDGEKPLSRWSKADIMAQVTHMIESGQTTVDEELIPHIKKMSLPLMKEWLLKKSSCHVTGNTNRHTWFYMVDKGSLEHLTKERIVQIIKGGEKDRNSHKNEESKTYECSFLEWIGPRASRIPQRVKEIGQIKGDWFYRKDGTRKSIRGSGFRIIREVAS